MAGIVFAFLMVVGGLIFSAAKSSQAKKAERQNSLWAPSPAEIRAPTHAVTRTADTKPEPTADASFGAYLDYRTAETLWHASVATKQQYWASIRVHVVSDGLKLYPKAPPIGVPRPPLTIAWDAIVRATPGPGGPPNSVESAAIVTFDLGAVDRTGLSAIGTNRDLHVYQPRGTELVNIVNVRLGRDTFAAPKATMPTQAPALPPVGRPTINRVDAPPPRPTTPTPAPTQSKVISAAPHSAAQADVLVSSPAPTAPQVAAPAASAVTSDAPTSDVAATSVPTTPSEYAAPTYTPSVYTPTEYVAPTYTPITYTPAAYTPITYDSRYTPTDFGSPANTTFTVADSTSAAATPSPSTPTTSTNAYTPTPIDAAIFAPTPPAIEITPPIVQAPWPPPQQFVLPDAAKTSTTQAPPAK